MTSGIVVALAALCGVVPLTRSATQAPAGGPGGSASQLVVPFDNASREPRLYWLTEGAAVLLTDDLRALGREAMTREERLRAFDELHVPASAALSHATVIRLGELLGASEVIVGSFDEREGIFTVRARAIRLDSGHMTAEIVESGPLDDLFGIFGRVARRLAPGSNVSVEQMKQGHPPLAAFEQYIKGVLADAPQSQLSYLERAVSLFPQFQRARLAQWLAFTESGEHKRALDAVRLVPDSHPLARRARFLGAISLLNLEQYDEAYDALTALNSAKVDPAVLNNLGIVQLRRPAGAAGGKAASFFAEASKLDPDDPDLFFNRGYAHWLEKESEPAIEALHEAVRRNPADDQAHYLLGMALQAAGSASEAAREHELARQLSSAWTEAVAKAGDRSPLLQGLERLKMELDAPGSLHVQSAIVASEKRDQRELAAFHLDRGRRLYQEERDDEALAELRRAVYLAPYQSEAHLLVGRIYLRSGRGKNAIDALKISIWSEDTNAARLALAEAYIREKDTDSARASLTVVLTRDPDNAEAQRLFDSLGRP
jgi:tetratricopeptide (TPR) repeat protein